jgi:hypothetical protein
MTIDHTGHASAGCNGFDLLANPPRKASESPDDLHLVKVLSFTGQIQPTVDELLAALARVMAGKMPPSTRCKFTRLELSHARVELNPTAVWNDNGELEVRVEA